MCSYAPFSERVIQYVSTRTAGRDNKKQDNKNKNAQNDETEIDLCGHGSPFRQDSNLVGRLQDNCNLGAVRSTPFLADLDDL